MIKLVGFVMKPEGTTLSEFSGHWLEVHSAIARRLPGLHRYTITIIDRAEFPDCPYDGFSQLWFESRERFESALARDLGEEIAEDIPRFLAGLTRVWAEEHVIVG
jgi:uncharacterized protein (TIGR02118 family)